LRQQHVRSNISNYQVHVYTGTIVDPLTCLPV